MDVLKTHIGMLKNIYDKNLKDNIVSWDNLGRHFSTPKIGPKDGPAFMPVETENGSRKLEHIKCAHLIVLDIDGEENKGVFAPPPSEVHRRLKQMKVTSFIYTTFGHSPVEFEPADDKKGIGNRYRVVILPSRTISPNDLPIVINHVVTELGLEECIDASKINAGSVFYLPRYSKERSKLFEFYETTGNLLDIDSILEISITKSSQQIRGVPDGTKKGIVPDKLKKAANGNWKEILTSLFDIDQNSLLNMHSPCPGCGGEDRFRFDDNLGYGTFICSQGGKGDIAGDGFKLLEHCGLPETESLKQIEDYLYLIYGFEGSLNATNQEIYDAVDNLRADPGAIFESDILGAIRQAKDNDLAEYQRIRNRVKKSKEIPMSDFDKAVEKNTQTDINCSSELFKSIEPWPEAIDISNVLDEIAILITRYIVAEKDAINAACLWIAHTWCIDSFKFSPIANITAPEKRCGKSTFLEVMQKLVKKALSTSNISPAALFRIIESEHPTLLIDEVDSFLSTFDESRGILNAGFSRAQGKVIRCTGDDHEAKVFDVFGAKSLCGIGSIADTLADRSIPLRLRRKLPSDKVEKLRHANEKDFEDICRKLARFYQDHKDDLEACRPSDIEGINDRANDCWEPLLSITHIAGKAWDDKARFSAIALHGVEQDNQSVGHELLISIKDYFSRSQQQKVFSSDLLAELISDEESPWAVWNRGKPMGLKQLRDKLKSFDIKSNKIRIGSITGRKGYSIEQFKDAWERYLTNDIVI